MDISEAVDLVMSDLERILGSQVYDALLQEIQDTSLGGMDIKTSILQRPDLFERAFIAITGAAGAKILRHICDGIRGEFGLEIRQSSGEGELGKLITDIKSQSLIDP